jgi:hypothetical protein
MPRARIAFISGFDYPYSTETHVARDAEAAGCEVEKIHERWGLEAIAFRVARSGADLVLYMKHHGVNDGDLRTVWDWCRQAEVRTASYHLDLYAGLDRVGEIGTDPMWFTDTVFTADGDPQTHDMCEVMGIDHRWLPAAVVSDETGRGRYRRDFARDVVFVGSSARYHAQWPWRQELIEGLHNRYRARFRVWGHHDTPTMRGQNLNDLYASVKVVVGDSLALPGHVNYWSDRYYETLGRGGFLVAPYVPGIDAHLDPGAHFFAYDPGELEQVFALTDAALANDDGRAQIARAGRARVIAQHTYQHRVRQLLQEVGL